MKKSNGRVTTLNVMTGEEFNAFRIFDDYLRDSVKRTNELELAVQLHFLSSISEISPIVFEGSTLIYLGFVMKEDFGYLIQNFFKKFESS